jgi:hypothetical protein
VPRDLVQAWHWLGRAAAQGNRWAAARRDAIETRIERSDLDRARRSLPKWRSRIE